MKRPMGRLASLIRGDAPSLFDFHQAFLCMCSQEGLLDFEKENMWSFYLLFGQGPAAFSILLLWGFSPQGTCSRCSLQGPSVSCLTGNKLLLISLTRSWFLKMEKKKIIFFYLLDVFNFLLYYSCGTLT